MYFLPRHDFVKQELARIKEMAEQRRELLDKRIQRLLFGGLFADKSRAFRDMVFEGEVVLRYCLCTLLEMSPAHIDTLLSREFKPHPLLEMEMVHYCEYFHDLLPFCTESSTSSKS